MFKVKTLNVVLVFMLLFCMVTVAQEVDESIAMQFVNDLAMGIPIQDVYIDTGMVQRVGSELTDAVLALSVYNSTERHDADFKEPFDIGPFTMEDALGFTLGDWLAATGTGTYSVTNDTAKLDLSFEHLVPDGVYTIWCVEVHIAELAIAEAPCGEADGSTNEFVADDEGNGSISIEIERFPASTEDVIYEVSLAYHSDGQTYGNRAGEFGQNVHVQLVYNFLPPEAD